MRHTSPLTPREADVMAAYRELAGSGVAPGPSAIAAHLGVSKVTVWGHMQSLVDKRILKKLPVGRGGKYRYLSRHGMSRCPVCGSEAKA